MLEVQRSVDPVVFEIMRHRLWQIMEEQSKVIVRMSGSPIVYEAKDFSTGIMTATGEGLFVSTYQPSIGATLAAVTRSTIERFAGHQLAPGDMFFSNDPWLGGVGHPNDQALVGPIFAGDEIIAWAGVALHDADIGATVPGVHPAAPDARHEGSLIPPVKMVERGVLREDLEGWATRTVRDPAANALHIRARMAAITNSARAIAELVSVYGVETFKAFAVAYVDHVRNALRVRLRELPDGTWHDGILIDHDGTSPSALFEVACTMEKRGETLRFDYRATDPPAPGPMNCARLGLESAICATVMSAVCYDLGWCPAALDGVVTVESKPNTVVTAEYPTPVGLATVAAMSTAAGAARSCISQMYAATESYRERAQGYSGMGGTGSMIWGLGTDGRPKMTLGSFVVSRGNGAYCSHDGEDAGGNAGTPAASIYNVETVEFANPLLVTLYRKEAPETAGAGTFRGGSGMEIAFTMRPGANQIHVNWGSMGFHHPHPKGQFGGLPGSVGGVLMLRNTNVGELLRTSRLPTRLDDIACERVDQIEAKTVDARLNAGDVLVAFVEGGGGYGDPLERDPELVRNDLEQGLCTPAMASELYGVILDAATHAVDVEASRTEREALRGRRLGAATPGADGRRNSLPCPHCGQAAGSPVLVRSVELAECSVYNRYAYDRGEIALTERLCSRCGTRLDMELARSSDGTSAA